MMILVVMKMIAAREKPEAYQKDYSHNDRTTSCCFHKLFIPFQEIERVTEIITIQMTSVPFLPYHLYMLDIALSHLSH